MRVYHPRAGIFGNELGSEADKLRSLGGVVNFSPVQGKKDTLKVLAHLEKAAPP